MGLLLGEESSVIVISRYSSVVSAFLLVSNWTLGTVTMRPTLGGD